jgi:GNAT superfamily N-acetyltransferase
VFDPSATRRTTRLRAGTSEEHGSSVTDLMIRRIDPQEPHDVDAFLDTYRAAELAADPAARLYTRDDATAMLGADDTSFFLEAYGAFDDAEVRGISMTSGGLRDNLTLAQVQLWVHPDHRRSGVGSALADDAEARLLRGGRTVLRTQVRAGQGHPGNQEFAESRGYHVVLTDIERRLPLPADRDHLARLAAEASERHADYDVHTVVGPFPAELRASYVALRNLLIAEMPSGGLDLEESGETVEDLIAEEARFASAGRTSVTGYAVQGDQVVAYAEASVSVGTAHADQFGTLVHPDHRGHRLGMAVKCAQLRALEESFPGRSYLCTTNAEVNEHMVAINADLGFEIHQVWMELEKRLESPGLEIG